MPAHGDRASRDAMDVLSGRAGGSLPMFAAIGHRWCAKIRKGLVYATLLQLVVLGMWNEAALQEMVGYVGLFWPPGGSARGHRGHGRTNDQRGAWMLERNVQCFSSGIDLGRGLRVTGSVTTEGSRNDS